MAAHLVDRRGRKVELDSNLVIQLLQDGNDSEIEGFDEDEEAILEEPTRNRTLGCSSSEHDPDDEQPCTSKSSQQLQRPEISSQSFDKSKKHRSFSTPPGNKKRNTLTSKKVVSKGKKDTGGDRQPRSKSCTAKLPQNSSASTSTSQKTRSRLKASRKSQPQATPVADESQTRGRLWKKIPFSEKEHNYPIIQPTHIRTPMEYFKDYFPDDFFENAAFCTNSYHMRKTGKSLDINAVELKKLIGIHFIMGCIPYPRLHMYWRQEMALKLVSESMARNRFKQLRTSFHVVDSDSPSEGNTNVLWKVQPVLDCVKTACFNLERIPGNYSIDEQMIPFCGVCPRGLRQVIKSKPRPQGLKVFITSTSYGLMIDFGVHQGDKTMYEHKSLGVGASVVLSLSKTVPPGSCLYFDRYFTSIPLLEKLSELGLHGTGTVMANRIPNNRNLNFLTDRQMKRGDSEQMVSGEVVVVKWMDNKSVLVASNCTSADREVYVKRWDKKQKAFIDVKQPLVIANYNRSMGGVDVLDQSIEYYRTFMKTTKWTLKVMLHFFDLAVANAWRLYKTQNDAARTHRGHVMDLLDFKLEVADGLINTPRRRPREDEEEVDDEDDSNEESIIPKKRYRPANPPSIAKRYDGYEHFPLFDEILTPRSCRMEGCGSRSKIKCEKCKIYLCLSRGRDCFSRYHRQ